MRQLTALFMSLILVFTGIACACGADAAPPTAKEVHGSHDHHDVLATPAEPEEAADCCEEDCDEASAASFSQSLPVAFDLRLIEEDFDDFRGDFPVAIDISWEDGDPSEGVPLTRTFYFNGPSPVLLSDRMLE